jgi:hypothetical protein
MHHDLQQAKQTEGQQKVNNVAVNRTPGQGMAHKEPRANTQEQTNHGPRSRKRACFSLLAAFELAGNREHRDGEQ